MYKQVSNYTFDYPSKQSSTAASSFADPIIGHDAQLHSSDDVCEVDPRFLSPCHGTSIVHHQFPIYPKVLQFFFTNNL